MTTPTKAENPSDPAAIAASLTKGAVKACLAMSREWQFPGKQTFDANGAHALHWKKRGKPEAICETELQKHPADTRGKRCAYRLTTFGEQVSALLAQRSKQP